MMEICGDDRFEIIAKAKEHLLEATNIADSEDEMKVLDSFLFRCWQMGWLDRYDEPEDEPLNPDLAKNEPTLVKDLVKAFGEDGTWLERQGVYTLTLAEAKQRAVDIIEAVLAKTEPHHSGEVTEMVKPQTENLFTDRVGDVWEWRGDAWYCISGDEPQTEPTTDCRQTKMTLDDAYYLVYKDLTKEDGILTGKYDAKNGNKQYMNGVWSVMELIAYGVGIDCYEAFNERFCRNLDKSQEQTKEPQAIAEDINRRVEMGKKEWSVRHIKDEPEAERSE